VTFAPHVSCLVRLKDEQKSMSSGDGVHCEDGPGYRLTALRLNVFSYASETVGVLVFRWPGERGEGTERG